VLAAIRTEPDESWAPTRGLADLDALVADLARAGLSITVRRRADFDVAPSPSAGTGDDGANGTGSPGRGRIDDAETDDAETDDAETDDGTGTEVAGHLDTPLPATIDVTAYRIVRESLTNVLKHAGEGATATVEIMRRPEALELRVTDTGRGALADDGGGHGLRGMQERVEVFGGRFSARPRLGGGFTVEASLPLDGHQATVDR
jgi:signal transduction histidine kinase